MLGTYVYPLIEAAKDPDYGGRVHTILKQTGAQSGRLSSAIPNLQNIPIRTMNGKMIRSIFAAPAGRTLLGCDQSQVEMRTTADQSRDPVLIDALISGKDTHSITATDIFPHVRAAVQKQFKMSEYRIDKLTIEMMEWVKKNFKDERDNSKTVNFMVLYGGGEGKYAESTGSTREEGKRVIAQFFKTYKGIRADIDRVVAYLHKHGCVRTSYLGRYVHFPEVATGRKWQIMAAERSAYNATTQGGAADLMKLAMLRIYRSEKLRKLGTTMQLQVHDELQFETPSDNVEASKSLIVKYVSRPQDGFGFRDMRVPTPVDFKSGRNWLETH